MRIQDGNKPMNEVIRHLRTTVLLSDGAGLTDGQLLERFIDSREEAAITALVRRNASMVWEVCRRVLRDHHDAEDAFQATFLVLVRKAESIAPRQMIANWLYGVAHQTALNAKEAALKRRGRERQVMEMPEPKVAQQDRPSSLDALLDQELSRLPNKYRVAIVLCDLKGKTRKDAACQLNIPEGTLSTRLMRAQNASQAAAMDPTKPSDYCQFINWIADPEFGFRCCARFINRRNHQSCKPACIRTQLAWCCLAGRHCSFKRSAPIHVRQQIQYSCCRTFCGPV